MSDWNYYFSKILCCVLSNFVFHTERLNLSFLKYFTWKILFSKLNFPPKKQSEIGGAIEKKLMGLIRVLYITWPNIKVFTYAHIEYLQKVS